MPLGQTHISPFTLEEARCIARVILYCRRPDKARTHYKEALKVATDMRFRPEIALTRLQLAELLLEHCPDEKSEECNYRIRIEGGIGEGRGFF